jgi:hypothetical protein
MPHMLAMTALQIRNPVPLFILMKSNDQLVHVSDSYVRIFKMMCGILAMRRGM